jgi:hypothetical protein
MGGNKMGRRFSIGELINIFDESMTQDVGLFNELFPHCQLGEWYLDGTRELKFKEYPREWSVEILGMVAGNTRRIMVNGEAINHEMPMIGYHYEKKYHGHSKPVMIDGIEYASIAEASKKLNLSRYIVKEKLAKGL